MTLGMIGLGRMGLNMTTRLIRGGHHVVAHDIKEEAMAAAREEGAETVDDISGFAEMEAPRAVWMMIPAGPVVDTVLSDLLRVLEEGDLVIDGGNSRYTDTLRRKQTAAEAGLHYVDVGVSGGIWGLAEGYSLMAGGPQDAVDHLTPILTTLAPAEDKGWGRVGPTGAGHFVKMVHNGIEYGMMQAFAEGFAVLEARDEFGEETESIDLPAVAQIWRHGSVIRSWLLDLAAEALASKPTLDGLAPYVPDSGEGRWTVQEAVELGVPAPAIAASLFARFQSRGNGDFADKMLSALRGQFGGHPVKAEEGAPDARADGTIEVVPGGPDTEGAEMLYEETDHEAGSD